MHQFVRLFTAVTAAVLFGIECSYAQVPTNQDCLGAIPICGPIYTTPSSTFGAGNYPNEDPPGTCLVPGEQNSLWFIFTVIASGDLAFTTYPVSSGADYDWAVYNITNATCEEIKTNQFLQSSCNSSQYGITGISATGVGNVNGPGPTSAFNYLLPVLAGETYVLNMNNWSGSTGGYTLDFSASTAVIYDSVKPKIDTVLPVSCTDSVLTVSFSEKLVCSSVEDEDFELVGPFGPYTISNVTGAACSVGGTQEVTFTMNISPPIEHGGFYTLKLTDDSGSVEDLCGNIADTTSYTFYTDGVVAGLDSFVNPFCAGQNGELHVSGTSGLQPYTYSWNGTSQTSGSYTGLDDTLYVITVTDAGGCWDTIAKTLYPSTGAVFADIVDVADALCYGSCDGSILAGAYGGVTPYQYEWSNGPTTAANTGLCIGSYSVIVTDQAGCKDTVGATVAEPPQLYFTLDSIRDVTCNGLWNGYAKISVQGGTPSYLYNWVPYGGNGQAASNINANTYTVEVIDNHGCHYDTTFVVSEPEPIVISHPADTTICAGTGALLHVEVSGGTPAYSFTWNTGATDNPYALTPETDSVVSVYVVDANGCTTGPVPYRIMVVQPPVIELGNDTLICAGNTLVKSVFYPGTLYEWQDGSITYDAKITEEGMYHVRAYNQCFEAFDSIYVDVDDCATCVHLPDVFTPNNDGLNDRFLPIIDCAFTKYVFSVFDRWGTLVFMTTDPNDGWDGRFGGTASEMGTYVWHLEYAGSKESLFLDQSMKGFVVLLR